MNKEIKELCEEKIENNLDALNYCIDKNSFYTGMCEGKMIAYRKIIDLMQELTIE